MNSYCNIISIRHESFDLNIINLNGIKTPPVFLLILSYYYYFIIITIVCLSSLIERPNKTEAKKGEEYVTAIHFKPHFWLFT